MTFQDQLWLHFCLYKAGITIFAFFHSLTSMVKTCIGKHKKKKKVFLSYFLKKKKKVLYSLYEQQSQKKSLVSYYSVPNLESWEVNGKSSIDFDRCWISPLNGIKPARRIRSIHHMAPTYFNSLPNISEMQTVREHSFIVRKVHGA